MSEHVLAEPRYHGPDDYVVEVLVDSSGAGRDGYAYTVGLDDHGLPELYVGPHAGNGSAAGLPPLSLQDRAAMLFHVAEARLAGDVTEGEEVTVDLGAGRPLLRCRLGEEEVPSGVLAIALQGRDAVIRVRWRVAG